MAEKDTEDKNRLISLKEASEIYGFDHGYLRKLIHRGRLKAQKIGNSWATTQTDIEEYIQSRSQRGVYRKDINALDE